MKTGKRVNPNLPTRDKTIALATWMGATPPTEHGLAVREVIDYYVEFVRKHRSQGQYADANNRLPHFVTFVGGGDTRLADLDKDHFIQYRDLIWGKMDERKQWADKQPLPITAADLRKAHTLMGDHKKIEEADIDGLLRFLPTIVVLL